MLDSVKSISNQKDADLIEQNHGHPEEPAGILGYQTSLDTPDRTLATSADGFLSPSGKRASLAARTIFSLLHECQRAVKLPKPPP
jgi:hypothetical protein